MAPARRREGIGGSRAGARALVVAAALALASGGAWAWEPEQFTVLLGWPTEVACPDDEALAQALSEAGINTVMWDLSRLELCRKYDLRLAVYHGAVLPESSLGQRRLAELRSLPTWPKNVPPLTPELVRPVLDDPAVWGYRIFDAPDEALFPLCAEVLAKFHAADPVRPAYVSVRPSGGEYLRRYLDLVRPRVLSFAHYQWWWGQESLHFPILEEHRRAALDAGLPLLRWVEVNAAEGEHDGPATAPADNAEKLRESVYTSLAYGIKGVEWFTARELFEPGAATLRPCGKDVAALNAELKHLGPVLVRLRSREVFHTGPVPPDCRPIPTDLGVGTDAPGIVLGVFGHQDDADADYLLVANKSIEQARDVRLRFSRMPREAEKLGKNDGAWATVRVRPRGDGATIELSLAPGDGELLRVRPRSLTIREPLRPGERRAEAAPLLLDDGPPLLLGDGPGGTAAPGTTMADNSRCHHCHLNYVQEQIALVHARAQMGCADCHGASDEHIADESWASGGNGTPPDTMYRREEVNAFCLGCHKRGELGRAEHEAFLAGTADEKHCTDCHGQHRLAVRRCKWK